MLVLNDFKTSVIKALNEIDENWVDVPGVIVAGSHSKHIAVPEILEIIKDARLKKIPFLGICSGLQLMAIEYARNVMGVEDATSEEFGVPGTFIVQDIGHLRVGAKEVKGRLESYWNRYGIGYEWAQKFDDFVIFFGDVIEEMQLNLELHPHFVGVQYHPEYNSIKDKPHPILKNFLDVCKAQ